MVKLSCVPLLIDVEWFVVVAESVTWNDDLVALYWMMTTEVNDLNAIGVFTCLSKLFTDKGGSFGVVAINPNVANVDLHGFWGVVERIVLHKQPRLLWDFSLFLINVSRSDTFVKFFLYLFGQ